MVVPKFLRLFYFFFLRPQCIKYFIVSTMNTLNYMGWTHEDHLRGDSLKLVGFIGVLLKRKERYNIPLKIKENFYFACFEQK